MCQWALFPWGSGIFLNYLSPILPQFPTLGFRSLGFLSFFSDQHSLAHSCERSFVIPLLAYRILNPHCITLFHHLRIVLYLPMFALHHQLGLML
jgi:hypothetical protein